MWLRWGGSVTTGMGAARREDAYLSLVVAWLRSLGDEAHPVRVQVQLASSIVLPSRGHSPANECVLRIDTIEQGPTVAPSWVQCMAAEQSLCRRRLPYS